MKYLVTGGTGFLGERLIEKLILEGNQIVTCARNEGKLIYLKNKFPSLTIIPGDIKDVLTCKQCCKDVDGIFHLAAFKHVRMAEEFSLECINSNIIGTINILNETLDNSKIKFIIGISTDKVANVNGVYGATKYLMESLFEQYEKINNKTKYRLVRYGNVLYSTGSVLCIWKEKIKKGEEIIISDGKITRFYWTLDEAINLIFKCLEKSKDCTPYLPEMKSMYLGDILEAMKMKYLPEGKELKIKKIGIQKGENFHEKLTSDGLDSSQVEKYKIKEIYDMI